MSQANSYELVTARQGDASVHCGEGQRVGASKKADTVGLRQRTVGKARVDHVSKEERSCMG